MPGKETGRARPREQAAARVLDRAQSHWLGFHSAGRAGLCPTQPGFRGSVEPPPSVPYGHAREQNGFAAEYPG